MKQPRYGIDAPFVDAVISLNVFHNIADPRERAQALAEVVRVLAPGGQFLIADFRNVDEYVRVLKLHGIADARKRLVAMVLFIPVFAAMGSKLSGTP